MKRALIAAMLLALAAMPLQAGQIKLGEVWYQFEQIIPPGGPERSFEMEGTGGLRAHVAGDTEFLNRPARVLLIMGKRWTNEYGDNRHLVQRFWPIGEVSMQLKYFYTDVTPYVSMRVQLHPLVQVGSRPYDLVLEFRNAYGRPRESEFFQLFADAAQADRDDYTRLSCLEVIGRLTWGRSEFGKPLAESKFTYQLMVESMRVTGKLPREHLQGGPKPLTLEEATERCTKTD